MLGIARRAAASAAAAGLGAASLAALHPTPLAAQGKTAAEEEEEYREAQRLLQAHFADSIGTISGQPRAAHRPPTTPSSPPPVDAPTPPNRCRKPQRVLVVGGGIMGSSAAYSLARRQEGHHVTLIDTGHPIRSSWGQERAARTAYDEPLFVRMMQRGFQLWSQLERDDPLGRQVMHPGKRLDVAPRGVLETLKEVQTGVGLGLEVFGSQAELDTRFPQVRLLEGEEVRRHDHCWGSGLHSSQSASTNRVDRRCSPTAARSSSPPPRLRSCPTASTRWGLR